MFDPGYLLLIVTALATATAWRPTVGPARGQPAAPVVARLVLYACRPD
jgi:hypothetical protein